MGLNSRHSKAQPELGLRVLVAALLNLNNVSGLRAFLPFNNLELDLVAFLEALIALGSDGAVVDEHIRAVLTPDKAETFCVVEPLHYSLET